MRPPPARPEGGRRQGLQEPEGGCPAGKDLTRRGGFSTNAAKGRRAVLGLFAPWKSALTILCDDMPPEKGGAVERLAALKKLPADFLRSLGVDDGQGGAVLVPYRRRDGSTAYVKTRNPPSAEQRFDLPKGTVQLAYGLWRLDDDPDAPSAADRRRRERYLGALAPGLPRAGAARREGGEGAAGRGRGGVGFAHHHPRQRRRRSAARRTAGRAPRGHRLRRRTARRPPARGREGRGRPPRRRPGGRGLGVVSPARRFGSGGVRGRPRRRFRPAVRRGRGPRPMRDRSRNPSRHPRHRGRPASAARGPGPRRPDRARGNVLPPTSATCPLPSAASAGTMRRCGPRGWWCAASCWGSTTASPC